MSGTLFTVAFASRDAALRVFLSYPYPDRELATDVRQALASCGFDVLSADQVRPGESLSAAIAKSVDSADAFVVLLTRASSQSQWALLEIGAAVASLRPVIPPFAQAPVIDTEQLRRIADELEIPR